MIPRGGQELHRGLVQLDALPEERAMLTGPLIPTSDETFLGASLFLAGFAGLVYVANGFMAGPAVPMAEKLVMSTTTTTTSWS